MQLQGVVPRACRDSQRAPTTAHMASGRLSQSELLASAPQSGGWCPSVAQPRLPQQGYAVAYGIKELPQLAGAPFSIPGHLISAQLHTSKRKKCRLSKP